MKMVGGAIGVIAGLILAIIGIINVIDVSGATGAGAEEISGMLETMGITVEGDDYNAAIEAKLEELRGTEGADPAMITSLEQMQAAIAEGMGMVGDIVTWLYIAIIGGVISAIVGFLAIKGTGVTMPGLLAVLGAALTIIAFILASEHTEGWILAIIILVGGVIAFLGAKQSPPAAA